jgi:hypothetical protein
MPPKLMYWIKFEGNPQPEKFSFAHLDEMWHYLREIMIRNPQRYGLIEWMQRTWD